MTPDERTAFISSVRTAATIELGGSAQQCTDAEVRIAERIATRAADLHGLTKSARVLLSEQGGSLTHVQCTSCASDPCTCGDAPKLPASSLFVRQDGWVPPEVAARFDAVLVAARIEAHHKRGRILLANRDLEWHAEVRHAGTEIVLWDWMVPPNLWEKRLDDLIAYAVEVKARAVLFNVEPGSGADKHDPVRDWRGKGEELRRFMAKARALCDAHGLEMWVTSWALPPSSFDLAALVEHADVCIPQPYEVHGRSGPDYVEEVLDAWCEAGADRLILGRGAHELDKSDDDSWRSIEQIEEHRKSTPAGMPEAWWTPAGSMRKRAGLVDAMARR